MDNSFGYASGYYDPLVPNTIFIKNDTNDKAFSHEFVHLLQSHKYPLNYLDEPVAELMSHEFFGDEIDVYIDEVNTLKLLICTIEPEPILECSFGGDSSKILEILKNNLETDDYDKMVSYLSQSSLEISEQQELQELIEKLYQNMYRKDMKDNLPGYDLIVNQNDYSNVIDNRYYLNMNKIELEGQVSFEVDSEKYDFITQNINAISVEDINYYKKEISQEEYNLINTNNSENEYESKIEYSSEIQNIIFSTNDSQEEIRVCILKDDMLMNISYQQAIEEGYIKFVIIASEDKINLEEGWVFDHQVKKVINTLPPITSRFSSSLNNHPEELLNTQVDKMITGMIDGTIDVNGNFISTPNNVQNNVKNLKGFSNVLLISIISTILSFTILFMGIYFLMK